MDAKIKQLEAVDIFSACRSDDLRWIARHGDEVEVPAGSIIATRDSKVREFVIVLDGVISSSDGVVYLSGSNIGLLGMIDGRPHSATLVAKTDATLLVFDSRTFSGLLDRVPNVSRKLMRELALAI